MKNTIKKILVVAFMLGTLIGYANENKTSFDDAKKVRVVFNSVKKGQTISLKNNNGTTIYNQEILISGKYSRVFNLTVLKKGNYTAELHKDFEIVVKPFTVKKGAISFNTSEEYKIFKPVVRTKKNLLFISKINLNEEPVKVAIYHNNEVIYSNTFTETPVLNKVFCLLENEYVTGTYKVIINDDNNSYVEEFKI
ncbi:hypothetical protein [Polaribacter sp.]|uniref:hypothetical protein n=1 Tax=Polaribacter sp. TaxID=1920175 RepID=UPI003EF2B9C1